MGEESVGYYFDEEPNWRHQDSPHITQNDTRYDQNGNLIRVPHKRYGESGVFGREPVAPGIDRMTWEG